MSNGQHNVLHTAAVEETAQFVRSEVSLPVNVNTRMSPGSVSVALISLFIVSAVPIAVFSSRDVIV